MRDDCNIKDAKIKSLKNKLDKARQDESDTSAHLLRYMKDVSKLKEELNEVKCKTINSLQTNSPLYNSPIPSITKTVHNTATSQNLSNIPNCRYSYDDIVTPTSSNNIGCQAGKKRNKYKVDTPQHIINKISGLQSTITNRERRSKNGLKTKNQNTLLKKQTELSEMKKILADLIKLYAI